MNINDVPIVFKSIDDKKDAMDIQSEQEEQCRATHLAQIDQAIFNFSEIAAIVRPARAELWKTTPSLDQIIDVYSPVGMKDTFRQLYRCLRTHLLQDKSNAAAFLQGNRGTGKSLVLRQCLLALQDEAEQTIHTDDDSTHSLFRVISVNGIAVPGRNLNAVIMEILYQLTSSASESSSSGEGTTKKEGKILELLRLKKTSSFTNNMQLLTEALELAHSERIPFLFVLDPLDAFIGAGGHSSLQQSLDQRNKQNQQLLLYYLLDRVATPGSLISFIGLTHDVHCLERLEKRTKSRAENAQFIYSKPFLSYEELVQAMLNNLEVYSQLQHQVGRFLQVSDDMTTEQENVVKCFMREYRLGKDARWFSRILSVALINYRHQCKRLLDDGGNASAHPEFALKHLVEAMLELGASLPNHRPCDPRIQALADLSSPQAVLILAARRILARDTQQKKDAAVIQLTLERILNEYNTAIQKGSLLSNRYSFAQMWRAFQELLAIGLFRPAADSGGKLAFQYMHIDSIYQDIDMNTILTRMPLHMTVDAHREVKVALEQNTMHCSTALREWGLKTN